MAGYTRNDTAGNIADGNVISAAPLDGEFDAIQDAFALSTGHTHDGSTTGDGGPVSKLGPSQQLEQTTTALVNHHRQHRRNEQVYSVSRPLPQRDCLYRQLTVTQTQSWFAPTVDIDASTNASIDTATLTITGAANVTCRPKCCKNEHQS